VRARARRRIRIVFRDFSCSAKTVWRGGFALLGDRRERRHRRRVPRLSAVGLHEHAIICLRSFRRGQQHCHRARAGPDPAILIADEPTGNLDPVTSWDLIQLLIQINAMPRCSWQPQ
jgi:cell division transport system ATP-binding protein